MKKISLFLLAISPFLSFAQEKKSFSNVDKVLSSIIPNSQSWALLKNNEELKNVGDFYDYQYQEKGFKLNPGEEDFYYIAYLKEGKTKYITSLSELDDFIGKIDNVNDAAVKAIAHGYYIDLEFKNIAGSYHEENNLYVFEIGKITSEKCPFEKRSFTLKMDKNTGEILSSEENETYTTIYLKDCENNPHRFIPPKKEKPKKVISIYR